MKKQFIYFTLALIFTVPAFADVDDRIVLNGMMNKLIAKADSRAINDPLLDLVSEHEFKQEIKEIKQKKASIKTDKLAEELRKSSLKRLQANKSSEINSQMQDVLNRLKGLDFVEKKGEDNKQAENAITDARVSKKERDNGKTQPAESRPDPEKTKIVKNKETDETAADIMIDDKKVIDTFSLAESLFLAGDRKNALLYYRKSMAKTIYSKNTPNPHRAWILFQIGNCLYNIDKKAAINAYQQLIDEHKSCEWVGCARTQLDILKWIENENPAQLVKSFRTGN